MFFFVKSSIINHFVSETRAIPQKIENSNYIMHIVSCQKKFITSFLIHIYLCECVHASWACLHRRKPSSKIDIHTVVRLWIEWKSIKVYFSTGSSGQVRLCFNLTSMNAHMYLLWATRSECFATFATWKLSSRDICMRVAMVHETASVRKLLTANTARNRFIAMRLHVAFEPCLVVEGFSAL